MAADTVRFIGFLLLRSGAGTGEVPRACFDLAPAARHILPAHAADDAGRATQFECRHPGQCIDAGDHPGHQPEQRLAEPAPAPPVAVAPARVSTTWVVGRPAGTHKAPACRKRERWCAAAEARAGQAGRREWRGEVAAISPLQGDLRETPQPEPAQSHADSWPRRPALGESDQAIDRSLTSEFSLSTRCQTRLLVASNRAASVVLMRRSS